MPFYKKAYNSKQKVHYPRAIVQGKPVETETIAKDLGKSPQSATRTFRPYLAISPV